MKMKPCEKCTSLITMFLISECGCNSYGFGICNKANFSYSSTEIYNKKSEYNRFGNLWYGNR